jgi:murein DD-endopeptidase MepM/ murein hydrolase activator NlpD
MGASAACVPAADSQPVAVADKYPGQLDAFPVVGPVTYTDDYGAPRSSGRSHQGTDLMANRGQKILAVESGTLASVGWSDISGYKIWLTADDGSAYFFAHLNSFSPGIETGARVNAGQELGTVGNTGNASGGAPHLHFEMHPGGRTAASVNPYNYLRTAQTR